MIINKKEVEIIDKAIKEKALDYLNEGNITAVGIAFKEVNKIKGSGLAIRFNVTNKYDNSELNRLNIRRIPEFIHYEGHEIPTDIVKRKYVDLSTPKIDPNRRIRMDTVQPGVSIGHLGKIGTVTLGAIIAKGNKKYGITCNHSIDGEYDDEMVQPSAGDDNNTENNIIGKIKDYGGKLDCTLIELDKNSRNYSPKVFGLDKEPFDFGDPEQDQKVFMSGCRTGISHGIVNAFKIRTSTNDEEPIAFEVRIDYLERRPDCELAGMNDSGSGWYYENARNELVLAGFQIASDDTLDSKCKSEFAFVHRAKLILNKFNLTIKK